LLTLDKFYSKGGFYLETKEKIDKEKKKKKKKRTLSTPIENYIK